MFRPLLFLLLVSLAVLSCKKDQISPSAAIRMESGTTHRLNRVLFLDSLQGFVVGGERFGTAEVLLTSDGGRSWSFLSFPDAGKALYGIAHAPDGTVRACGFDGKLLITSDTGKTWGLHQSLYLPFNALAWTSADHTIGVGGISYEMGHRITTDRTGGQLRYDSIAYQLNDIVSPAQGTAFAVGTGVVEWTSDDGQSWNFLNPAHDNFSAVDYCPASGLLTACGTTGSIWQGRPDGSSWKKLRSTGGFSQPSYALLDIAFRNTLQGYAVGENGLLLCTDDGGEHWMELEPFTSAALRGLALIPGTNALIVCGDGGEVWRITR